MEKNQRNKEGKQYGYWEVYNANGKLHSKGNIINNKPVGYWESYYTNGILNTKEYYYI